MSRKKLIEIKGMKTQFKIGDEWAQAVNGVEFDIYEGEALGIVGESGSGKSVSVLSLIQLIPNPPGEVSEGEIYFKGEKIFDGKDLERVNAIPKYKYMKGLVEKHRTLAAACFYFGWLILHSFIFSGWLPFLISFILDGFVTGHVFFNSPRKKAYSKFRDEMYNRMRQLRGGEIAMIFQEPMTSLNPVFTIGMQVQEAIHPKSLFEMVKDWIIRMKISLSEGTIGLKVKGSLFFAFLALLISQISAGWTFYTVDMIKGLIIGALIPVVFGLFIRGLDLLISKKYHDESDALFNAGASILETVGIPDPHRRMRDYPHQFSGGMRQRVMIAMALARNPSLLIADEPTTALDVTVQAQILDLMLELRDKREDSAVVLITHDLAVIAETCERVIVMYGGMIQEIAEVESLFDNPLHPYTLGLLNSIPHPESDNKKKRLDAIRGMVPNIMQLPVGCKFCTRCDEKIDKCDTEEPKLVEMEKNHFVRCHVVQDRLGVTA